MLKVYNFPADAARLKYTVVGFLSLYTVTVNHLLAIRTWCTFLKKWFQSPRKKYFTFFCWPFWMCLFLYLDIDECQALVPSPCSCGVPGEPCGATCTNTVPGYFCTCANGFQLRSGGTICDGNLSGFEFTWSRLNSIFKILKRWIPSQRTELTWIPSQRRIPIWIFAHRFATLAKLFSLNLGLQLVRSKAELATLPRFIEKSGLPVKSILCAFRKGMKRMCVLHQQHCCVSN